MNFNLDIFFEITISLVNIVLIIVVIRAFINCKKKIDLIEENTRKSYYTLERILLHQDEQYKEIQRIMQALNNEK